MGTFKSKEDYLKALCIAHPTVAHEEVVGGIARNSFFRLNNEEEMLAATFTNINYPAVGYYSLRGRTTDQDDALTDIKFLFSNAWIFLQHVNIIDLGVADKIQACYDQTFSIMEDFIKSMKDDFETNGHCGAFQDFSLNKMNFEMVGPVLEMEYGWILFFDDSQKATRLI